METDKKAPPMDATLYGGVTKPVVAFAGSWDPILPSHIQLVKRLADYAQKNDLASMLTVFDPAPAMFVLKEKDDAAEWITYNETSTNITRLLQCGLDAILVVHFQSAYLAYGAAELFETIHAYAHLAEFWFGARQSFGRGAGGTEGTQATVVKLAKSQGFRLRRLAQVDTAEISRRVRKFVATGHLAEAVRYVHYPLIRQQPQAGVLNLPWKPGLYQALPLKHPKDVEMTDYKANKPLKLTLHTRDNRVSVCEWPDPKVPYLAFIAGPQDVPYDISNR